MSEIKLNLVDAHTILAGTIHGSVGDACVAALTAEPETIDELEAALGRYIKPDEHCSQFPLFRRQSEIDGNQHDAGLVIIDLAARVVAADSSYSELGPEGVVHYHDGTNKTDIPIRYRLGPEWLFVNSVDSYRWSSERRRADRQSKPPMDTRGVLYGRPLMEFIVAFQTGLRARGFTLPPLAEDAAHSIADEIVKAHAAWLTMPRDELRGQAPRDVMLEKRDLIESDMDSRGWQWSMQGEGPPCLPQNSYGYRYGGFGAHEWVVYYDLVRRLFCIATLEPATPPDGSTATITVDLLERSKSDWLESPNPDYDGRSPALIIDNERRRLPLIMTADQLMIDEDCECCQMLARDAAMGEPTFWHLDGCNMEDEFAFSTCLTIQEWDAKKRREEELALEFARRDAERRDWDRRQLNGEPDPESWQPVELTDHEMVELLEQMKLRRPNYFVRPPEENEEIQTKSKERVN